MARWAFLLAMLAVVAWGDSWRIAKKSKTFSANRQFRVEVIAAKRAVLSARGALGLYKHKASFPLLNDYMPYWVIVSDDGRYLVTFDEAGALGYGDTVVAIYRTNGALIRRFSLEQLLTPDDIGTLPKSVSSIWWCGKHYLNNRGQLVLRVVSNGRSSWDGDATFHELRINLESGEPVEPKRDLFAAIYPKHTIRIAAPTQAAPETFAEPRCLPNSTASFNQQFVSPDLLRANLLPYPHLARTARIQGIVIADAQLNAQGIVDCVRIRQGHALFREATYDALLNARVDHAGGGQSTVAVIFELRN